MNDAGGSWFLILEWCGRTTMWGMRRTGQRSNAWRGPDIAFVSFWYPLTD